MTKWPPLPETAASIDATLKDIAGYIDVAAEAMVPPPEAAPRVEGAWPWAPGTIAQGFLGGRWNRRDGDVYAGGAAVAVQLNRGPSRSAGGLGGWVWREAVQNKTVNRRRRR